MKTILKNLIAVSFLLAICFTTSSFSSSWGGEGFEIYLNNKLVLQQFGKDMNTIKNLQIDQRFSNDQLTIKYYHCGQAGKSREITVKDLQNRMLKEWRFNDASASSAGMNCPVNDILSLQKKSGSSELHLYYSSKEIPDGRQLINIISARNVQTEP